MSFDNNPLLRRKKTGEDLDPAKLKAALQSRQADGAKAAFVLSDLEDMKLADVRKHLRLRNLNPLGGLVETKERLRESLQAEVDAANANVSSIQYRQAAREAREAGQLPISLHYDSGTHDAMMGPLNLHSTAEYTKESKIKLKKDRKLKQRVVHQFNVPGGRMKAGFINVVNKGWGHEALEYITINDWPVKNVTWQEGDWSTPPSHCFEFRKQWYQLVYRGNPLMGPASLGRCDAVQDSQSGNIKLIFRYLGDPRRIPSTANEGAVPKRIVKRWDVVGVRNAVGPQPKGYEEALAALERKEYLEEQHQILEELKAEREEWVTGHDEQGYLYYEKADGGEVDAGGTRQYEVPEVQQLLERQLDLLGYLPGVLEEKREAKRAELAAEKEAAERAEQEAHEKKVAGITAELRAVEARYEAMAEDLRMEKRHSKRAEKERQLHKVRLQLKRLREYLTEVAGRAALSAAATKSEQAEAAAVMEFKPLTEEERLALEKEQAEEKRRREEEDRNDPDQPVGDPRLWRPRAVVKWFLASKVAQYAGAFEQAGWTGQQLLDAGEPELEALGIRSHIHRVIIVRQVMALCEEWENTLTIKEHELTEATAAAGRAVRHLGKQIDDLVISGNLPLFKERHAEAAALLDRMHELRDALLLLVSDKAISHIELGSDAEEAWENSTNALRALETAHEAEIARLVKLEKDQKDAAAMEKKLKKAVARAYEGMDDVIPPAKVASAAATLLALLRKALQLNLVTEQSDAVQETRALVKELFQQVATNVELVFDQLAEEQEAEDREKRRRAAAVAVGGAAVAAENERANKLAEAQEHEQALLRGKRRAECMEAEAEVQRLAAMVPPIKTIDGEGWDWIPKKWLDEVGRHLFHREPESAAALGESIVTQATVS